MEDAPTNQHVYHSGDSAVNPTSRLAFASSWILLAFRLPCLKRWFSLLILSLVGSVLAIICEPLLSPIGFRLGDAWGANGVGPLIAILLTIVALLSVPLIEAGGLRLGHLLRPIRYPPTWVAAVLAILELYLISTAYCGFPVPSESIEAWGMACMIFILSPVLALLLANLFRFRPKSIGKSGPSSMLPATAASWEELAANVEGRLLPWLERELPISKSDEDLFGTRRIAERIAERIYSPRLNTIGICGPQGVGKSSVLNMVRNYLRDSIFLHRIEAWYAESGGSTNSSGFLIPPRIIICDVSVWGMVDSSVPVVILRRAIASLSHYADCLSVAGIPEQYSHAIDGLGPAWLRFPLVCSEAMDPTERIRKLEPILTAIHARLIIFIDDADRMSHTSEDSTPNTDTLFSLQALLDRLSGMERISFVLAATRH